MPVDAIRMIDAHVHVFQQGMPLVPNPRHAPTYSFTVEQLVATLDANGVDKAVIAAASPWGDYNDYVVESLRKHPARLRGTIMGLFSFTTYVSLGMAGAVYGPVYQAHGFYAVSFASAATVAVA
mgnify:CR=1 FL=1